MARSNNPKFFFIIILIITSLAITGFSLVTIYSKAIKSIQSSLTDMVNHQVTLVKVLKEQGKTDTEIIAFFMQMREKQYALGKSGEIVIAWLSKDSIEYVISSKPSGRYAIPLNIPGMAIPMKTALTGKTGFIKARDYQAIMTYAAYAYVPEIKWGIVAKISAREINNPFIQTSVIAVIISVILITICGILYTRITNPLIKKTIESEEKFKSLFHNITEGVALHEILYENNKPVNYKIIDVNPAFQVHTGIDPKNAINKTATELYGTTPPPYLKEYAEVAETGKPIKFETEYPPLTKHFIISAISPKKGQFATVFEDISDLKQIEQELKHKNEELTRFIYTVSHDLKSPLVTIKSFTDYLKEDIEKNDRDAQEKDMKFINNAANKMGRLLEELLELSRIGKKETPKSEILLEEVVQMATDLVAGQIKEKDVKVRLVGPSVILFGHVQRFVQLYQNLIDNSVKFMGSQTNPFIELGALDKKGINGEITLFIRDNGAGIDSRYHHKLFGLFEKLDSNSGGTGIGLALVKRIIEVHGGTIWFTSEGANKGTTFYFTLEKTKFSKK